MDDFTFYEVSSVEVLTDFSDLGDIWEMLDQLEDEDPFFRIPKSIIPGNDFFITNQLDFFYHFSLRLAESIPYLLEGTICTNAP